MPVVVYKYIFMLRMNWLSKRFGKDLKYASNFWQMTESMFPVN